MESYKALKSDSDDIWTLQDLELEAAAFVSDLNKVISSNCPFTTQKAGLRKVGWWDGECKRLHIRMQSIRNYLRRHNKFNGAQTRAKYTYDDFVQCRRGFKAACRKAKRKAWQTFIGEIDTSPEVARLNHVFNKRVNKDIGVLRDPGTGELCSPKERISTRSFCLPCTTSTTRASYTF